jgi:hypothetical protein
VTSTQCRGVEALASWSARRAGSRSHDAVVAIIPDEACIRLGEELKQEIGHVLPVTITEVLSAEHIQPQPNGDWLQFTEIGKTHKLEYVVVVVLSSTEQE